MRQREKMMAVIRENMLWTIENMTDVSEAKHQMDLQFEVLSLLGAIEFRRENRIRLVTGGPFHYRSPRTVEVEASMPAFVTATGTFTRRLRGGMVGRGPDEVYLNERVVRDHTLTTGDIVEVNIFPDGDKAVTVIGQDPSASDDIREIRMAFVSETADGFVAESMLDGSGVSAIPDGPIPIRDMDVRYHELSEGDLVDLANYASCSGQYAVRWRHRMNPAGERRAPRTVQRKEKPEREPYTGPRLKEAKSFFVVSYGDHLPAVERVIHDIGGTVTFSSSKKLREMRAGIQSHDMTLLLTQYASHIHFDLLKKSARKSGKPFVMINQTGRDPLLHQLRQALGGDLV